MNDLFYEYMDNCMVLFFFDFSSYTNIIHDFIKKIRKITLYTKLINLNSIVLKSTIIDLFWNDEINDF
jgi:uncharacterized Fe-S cluster-containing MiaB family protein